MSKVYAVRQGRQVGVFHSWSECEEVVKGYAGAEYKSFKSLSDAEAYLSGEAPVSASEPEPLVVSAHGVQAYVDGSFNEQKGAYAWAFVLIKGGDVLVQDSGTGNDEQLTALRNVSGELAGTMRVALWAEQHKIPVTIHYDYAGIENWATGAWRAKNPVTQMYKAFMQKMTQVSFQKVKAHSGNRWNEYVDGLARQAFDSL